MTHAMISSGITSSARMIIIICREANGKIRTMPGTGKIAYRVLNHFLMKVPARWQELARKVTRFYATMIIFKTWEANGKIRTKPGIQVKLLM